MSANSDIAAKMETALITLIDKMKNRHDKMVEFENVYPISVVTLRQHIEMTEQIMESLNDIININHEASATDVYNQLMSTILKKD